MTDSVNYHYGDIVRRQNVHETLLSPCIQISSSDTTVLILICVFRDVQEVKHSLIRVS